MNNHPNVQSGSPGRSRTYRFEFLNVAVASLIALAAVVIHDSPLVAQGQDGDFKPFRIYESRDMRFGEILVVRQSGIEIYNTSGPNEFPDELWNDLDMDSLKRQHGALLVATNGPLRWMMDSQVISVGETDLFGGVEARLTAWLTPAPLEYDAEGVPAYKVYTPRMQHKMVFAKGNPVYELVDPDRHVYVMQARNEKIPSSSLAKLGEKLKKLPTGWQYRTRLLDEDLVLKLGSSKTIYAVRDEFQQCYTRIPEAE